MILMMEMPMDGYFPIIPVNPELKIEDLRMSLRCALFIIDRSTQKLSTGRIP